MFIERFATDAVEVALSDTPVVMLAGPRQSGKTTLVKQLAGEDRRFITLDEETALRAARDDPSGLVRALDRAIIDEVQLAPDLLRAIKRSVDEDRRPGRFLLTGSANILTIPKVSESLAGRMELITLLPLSRGEIISHRPTFLEKALAGALAKPPEKLQGRQLVEAVLIGGYPEMLTRKDASRRRVWARDYVQFIIQRDVREIASIEKITQVPALLSALAQCSGNLVNFTQVAGQIGLDRKTAEKYTAILEHLYLVRRVQPWFHNRLSRLIKTPKLQFLDAGLLAAILGITPEHIANERSLFGPLLEAFVLAEVMKQQAWLSGIHALHYYRDKDQDEVDIVVESGVGDIVGIEVKASATVGARDFRGLRKLASAAGRHFKMGVVLYDGEQAVPFGERLCAAPIPSVWG